MPRLLRRIFGMSRLSRPKSGISRVSRPKLGISRLSFDTMMIRRDFGDRSGSGAAKTARLIFGMSRHSRPRFTISRLSRPKNSGATFATEVDTARPCGSGKSATGATNVSHFQTFQTEMETARLFRPKWRRRDLKKFFRAFATDVETARLKKQRLDRPGERDQKVHFQVFRDRGADGATFQTETETHVQTFKTQTLGATMQFGSKSGCGTTLKVWT